MPPARPCAKHRLHIISSNPPDNLEELGIQGHALTLMSCCLLCGSMRRLVCNVLLWSTGKGPAHFWGVREEGAGMTYGVFQAAKVLGWRPRKQEQVWCSQGCVPRLVGLICSLHVPKATHRAAPWTSLGTVMCSWEDSEWWQTAPCLGKAAAHLLQTPNGGGRGGR